MSISVLNCLKKFQSQNQTRLCLFRITVLSLLIMTAVIPFTSCATGYGSCPWLDETGRTVTVLDTGWKFKFTGSDNSILYAGKTNLDSCVTVTLPHVFPSDKPGVQPSSGYGWYFREIDVFDNFKGKNVSLSFEGVCLRAEVFVNGIPAGGCKYAYLPFSVDLDSFIQENKVLRIAVRVDSRLLPAQIPDPAARGWWIYGGIGREVSLVVRGKQRIDGMQIRTYHHADDTFDLHCSLTPPGSIRWDSVSVVISPQEGGSAAAAFTFTGNDTLVRIGGIHAWTPEDPFRYQMRFTPWFGGEKGPMTLALRGFCQLATKKTRLILNGKPYYLRGIARHDILRLDGTPPTREERLKDLSDLKSMGVNFLRIAHFPQHRDIYELCDSIGILVMDEIPAWKTDPVFLGSKSGREYGKSYMQELTAVHGNYTSLAVWSIGNQFKSYKTAVADFVGTVASAVKQADPSRLVTFCSYYYIWDKAFESLDLIAVNEYFGWELASLDMLPPMLDKINQEWPDKPVIVSELGAQAQFGLRNAEAKLAGPVKSMLEKDISEDHQALFIAAHMDSIRSRNAYVNGMVVWAYNDYMAVMNKKRPPGTPKGFNGCGIVTAEREHKMSYQMVRERYTAWRDSAASEQDMINGQ